MTVAGANWKLSPLILAVGMFCLGGCNGSTDDGKSVSAAAVERFVTEKLGESPYARGIVCSPQSDTDIGDWRCTTSADVDASLRFEIDERGVLNDSKAEIMPAVGGCCVRVSEP